MSPKKLVLLTAVVAALFGFIFLFERKMPTTADRERKGDLYWDIPEERLERLVLVRGGETLEFQKTDQAPWHMVKPEPYPADAFAVNSVAKELAQLKRSGGDSNDARPADYGLEQPATKATLVWTDPDDPKTKKTRTVEFGIEIPGTDIVAAREEGSATVLFVPSSALQAVKKSADEFRSREVFGASDVARLEILRGRGRLVLARKEGAWWLEEPMADLADAAEADRLVGQLSALRVRDFIHGNEDLAALGLNPPLYRVTVTGTKATPASVEFGATRSDGNTVYARRDAQVFTVDRDIVDELSKESEPFRSTALVGFNRSDVTGVEGSFPKASVTLAQKDGGWTSQGRPVLAPSADDVLTAILAAKSTSFLEEAKAKAAGPALATVTVRTKSGPPWVLSLYAHAGGLLARVSPRPGGFVVDRGLPLTLEAAFQKAAAAPTPTKPASSKR